MEGHGGHVPPTPIRPGRVIRLDEMRKSRWWIGRNNAPCLLGCAHVRNSVTESKDVWCPDADTDIHGLLPFRCRCANERWHRDIHLITTAPSTTTTRGCCRDGCHASAPLMSLNIIRTFAVLSIASVRDGFRHLLSWFFGTGCAEYSTVLHKNYFMLEFCIA